MPMTWTYKLIKTLFKMTSGAFYATIELRGEENIPKPGEACILCFNHGNGLADPKLIIRATPRMVRFCAKDTLWKIPIMGTFIANSGAVPVYRRRDHKGKNTKELNAIMFKNVYDALGRGEMIGIAPEGVSRFLPFMAEPLKTGPARMALAAVELHMEKDENYQIKLLPTCITFTHREKFRSDVVLIYSDPIIVDKTWINNPKRFPTHEDAVKELTRLLGASMKASTINCPDWETTQVALTAARIHRPLGTKISLGDYVLHLRSWVEFLKPPSNGVDDAGNAIIEYDKIAPDVKYLREKLIEYQTFLNSKKIKDDRVRKIEFQGRMPRWVIFLRMIQTGMLAFVLFICALPGLVVWTPSWFLIRRAERNLLAKGPRWNDSVAEMKMLYGFLSTIALFVLSAIFVNWKALLLPIVLWFTIRFYEDGIAAARDFYSLYKLLFLYDTTMEKMRSMRKECVALVTKLSLKSVEIKRNKSADNAIDSWTERDENIPWYDPYWFDMPWTKFLINFIMRRQKKDWNEVLRFNDHNTMNYVE